VVQRASASNSLGEKSHAFADEPLVSLIKRPLSDALASDEPRKGQDAEMLAHRRRADFELLCDVNAADAVFFQIAVHLGGEVLGGLFQPVKNLQPAFICQRLENYGSVYGHLAISPILVAACATGSQRNWG
jgi:hypothetical protein